MRSVLDIADLELKGVPGVLFVEPSWYNQAVAIGRTVDLAERRVQMLPLGKVTSNSEHALPLMIEHLQGIIAGLEQALSVPLR